MTDEPSLPHAPAELIASYQTLLDEAIISLPSLSVISLARSTNDEVPEHLHLGAVLLAGLIAPSLDEPESLAAFLAALRFTYSLPTLTHAQAVVFLDFATFINEVTTAELHNVPLTVYPEGALWTLAGGFPALWLGGPWRLVVNETHHEAPSLKAAIELGKQFTREGGNR